MLQTGKQKLREVTLLTQIHQVVSGRVGIQTQVFQAPSPDLCTVSPGLPQNHSVQSFCWLSWYRGRGEGPKALLSASVPFSSHTLSQQPEWSTKNTHHVPPFWHPAGASLSQRTGQPPRHHRQGQRDWAPPHVAVLQAPHHPAHKPPCCFPKVGESPPLLRIFQNVFPLGHFFSGISLSSPKLSLAPMSSGRAFEATLTKAAPSPFILSQKVSQAGMIHLLARFPIGWLLP